MNNAHSNITILNAFNAALQAAYALPDSEEKKIALKRLFFGSVRRSKVEGVNSALSVQEMIMRLTKFYNKMPVSDTQHCFRFGLPHDYRGFTPVATVEQLHRKGELFFNGISLAAIRGTNGQISFKFHAPNIRPMSTNMVTFVFEGDKFVEWFAGEYEFRQRAAFGDLITGSAEFNIGDQRVALGVNLAEEARIAHFRSRPIAPARPRTNTPAIKTATSGVVAAAFAVAETVSGHKVLETPAAPAAAVAPELEATPAV